MVSLPDADLVRRDPALPGLGTVLDPARFVAALRAARPELGIEAVHVGRLLGPDGPLVLKVCAAKDYAATVATAGALGSRGLLRIPRVLGCSDQHRVLAF